MVEGGESSSQRAESPNSFGGVLRRARAARGLTLQALADRLRDAGRSCGKSYLSELENDRRPPPEEGLIGLFERVLRLPSGSLVDAARWARTPEPVRVQVSSLEAERRLEQQRKGRVVRRLREMLAQNGVDQRGTGRGRLDAVFRSGELRRCVEELEGSTALHGAITGARGLAPVELAQEVPLINSVAAGYPREFTDLGYPARVADQYVRVPDIADADAFAARVVGDSMSPSYIEGDIVVFSPAKEVKSGADCFARLEPDHQTTFKRVYFETSEAGEELIRLQPINPAYPARTLEREQVAGLYAAVTVMRKVE